MSDDPRYHLARWKGPQGRRTIQLRDFPLCAKCEARGVTKLATVADHVIPHRGDDALFRAGELQSLCKRCHDKLKQAEELHGYHSELDASGWPSDPRHPSNAGADPREGGPKSLQEPRSDTGGGLFCAAPHNSDQGV